MAHNETEWQIPASDCCSPFSSFMLAWYCPCVSFGRAHYRLTKDASLDGYSCCNGHCIGYACLMHCGLSWILQMMQRGDLRAKYHIQGNGCKDCLCSWFCTPCDLVQQNKEIQSREGGNAQFVAVQPEKNAAMHYGA